LKEKERKKRNETSIDSDCKSASISSPGVSGFFSIMDPFYFFKKKKFQLFVFNRKRKKEKKSTFLNVNFVTSDLFQHVSFVTIL